MEPLTPCEMQDIGFLIAGLVDCRFDPTKQRELLLHEVTRLVPCSGPCSILQLNRFFSVKHKGVPGKILDRYHIQVNDRALELVWNTFLLSSVSDIEERISIKRVGSSHGYYTKQDLFDNLHPFKESMFYALSRRAKVSHLSYLWIILDEESENPHYSTDLWVLCLRRLDREEDFSNREQFKAVLISEILFGSKETWYLKALNKFTRKQREVITFLSSNPSGYLGNIKTYNRHLEDIKLRLDVKHKSEILEKIVWLSKKDKES